MDVAVVRDDIADQCQRERQRMRGDFADAIVGRIGDPDAVARAGRGIDVVEAGADPADDAELRRRGDDLLGDRRVLRQDSCAIGGRSPHLAGRPALRGEKLDAGVRKELAFEVDVRVVEVGVQDSGHAKRTRKGGANGTCTAHPGQAADPAAVDSYNR